MFENSATAGSNALYSCDGTIHFVDSSNAGKSTFVFSGGTVQGHGGGGADFRDSSSAADATFIVEAGTVAGASGGIVVFFDGQVSAGNATIIANGGTIANAKGGEVTFFAILPSEPTIICHGGVNGGTGAELMFFEGTPGNLAHVRLNGDAFMDMSIAGDVTIGSLAGNGLVDLGDFTLTVGGNNQNTLFSGLLDQINTEGFDAGLKKVGSGTLRLSHDNMFKGGITIAGGAVVMENQSWLSFWIGRCGGSRRRPGRRRNHRRSGRHRHRQRPGSFPRPWAGSQYTKDPYHPEDTHLQSRWELTLWKVNTKKATADQVVANGVTIESGAQFDFNSIGSQKLTTGEVFTAINNTATTPISGTFSNLADGTVIDVGVNRFQVSYSGGDGNDLTLKVVP